MMFPTPRARHKEAGKAFAANKARGSEWQKGVRSVRADDSDRFLAVAHVKFDVRLVWKLTQKSLCFGRGFGTFLSLSKVT